MLLERAKTARAGDGLRFAAFLIGETLLVVAFIALARAPGEHAIAYYAKLVAVEIACAALALAAATRES